jgi:hypothetical protein
MVPPSSSVQLEECAMRSTSSRSLGRRPHIGSALLSLSIITIGCWVLHSLTGVYRLDGITQSEKTSRTHIVPRRAIPGTCKGKERVLQILERAIEHAVDAECRLSPVPSVSSGRRVNRPEPLPKHFNQSRVVAKRLHHGFLPSQKRRNKLGHVYGVTTCNVSEMCQQLPQWKQVVQLYGDRPVILGLETCVRYRETLEHERQSPNNATLMRRSTPAAPRVTGLYNSGTNALMVALADNFVNLDADIVTTTPDGVGSWEVPWGKHVPPTKGRSRFSSPTELDAVLPIVIVRDPFRWMASMVRARATSA